MTDTSARLLKLLSLLQLHREWTGAELAERLGVSGRTVRKDVDRLRGLGYPVDATRGATGGYRLGAGATMPPLLLDDEEAVATAIGLSSASARGIAGIEEASLRALAKLEQVLPSRLRHRAEAIRSFAAAVRSTDSGPEVDPEVLQRLVNACRDREKQRIAYESHEGARSRRMVEPHRLVSWGHRWYLVAWDDDRNDWRTFRVDRIAKSDPSGIRFSERTLPDPDITGYISRNVSRAGWRYRARIVMHASAGAVARRIPSAYATIEPIDDESCVLETGADDLWSIAVCVGALGFDFTVEAPEELVQYVALLADRYRRAVS